jgi:hypothetical protein
MSDIGDAIIGIITIILIGWAFIEIGKIFHLFDWVGPTIAFIWQIIQIIFVILLLIGVIYLVYYILSGILKISEQKKKKEQKEKIIEIGKVRRKNFEEMGISYIKIDDYKLGSYPENELEQLKDQLIKAQKEHEIKTIAKSRRHSLSESGISHNLFSDFELGSKSEQDFLQLKETLIKEREEEEKILERGGIRRRELEKQGVSDHTLNDHKLGKMDETKFIQYKDTLIKEKEEKEKILKRARVRRKDLEKQGVSNDALNDYELGKMDETQFIQHKETLIKEKEEKEKILERARVRRKDLEKQGVSDDALNDYELGKMDETQFIQHKETLIKDTLIFNIIKSIKSFEPQKAWGNEDAYHKELLGWLKHEFPNVQYELQTGSSRPDLVIEKIAIEIKGPTTDNSLNTLATKILKYSHHYNEIVIVLFETSFSEKNYQEILNGIEKSYSHVHVIRK